MFYAVTIGAQKLNREPMFLFVPKIMVSLWSALFKTVLAIGWSNYLTTFYSRSYGKFSKSPRVKTIIFIPSGPINLRSSCSFLNISIPVSKVIPMLSKLSSWRGSIFSSFGSGAILAPSPNTSFISVKLRQIFGYMARGTCFHTPIIYEN